MIDIIHTENIVLSPVYTLRLYWFDLRYQNPMYVAGTDPNHPSCGIYQNGVLVSNSWWDKDTITLEKIESYLEGEHHKNLHWLRIATNHEPIPEFI